MATAAQFAANQKNAQASTGPRTEEGKAASSQNAVKHGATSQNVVLAFENRAEFEAMRRDLFRTFRPLGGVESFLVEEMAGARWRIMRMERVIRQYIDDEVCKHPSRNPTAAMAAILLSPGLQKLQRYENSFRRVFDNAWKKLKELQKVRLASKAQNEPKSLSIPSVPPLEPASAVACTPAADMPPVVSAAASTPGR